MPVYPIFWQPLVKTGDYPHMAKHDATIWERFLDELGGNFSHAAYDVALGGIVLGPELGSVGERLGWQYSTALKIDVVLQQLESVWIVEVKPQAGVSALGAALCYTVLAEQEQLSPLPLVPAVVTDHTSPDIRRCAQALGVTLVELDVPPLEEGPEALPGA